MRLIDAEWLKELYEPYKSFNGKMYSVPVGAILANIDDAPSIDIVRCSECVYCNVQNTKYLYAICERHGIEFKPFEDDTRTHGCAWGKRKESE